MNKDRVMFLLTKTLYYGRLGQGVAILYNRQVLRSNTIAQFPS